MDLIIRQLNEVLDFMLEIEYEIGSVTPQHIIQHFQNESETIDLTHAISLLQTLQTEENVIEVEGRWLLTDQGRLLAQIGGYLG